MGLINGNLPILPLLAVVFIRDYREDYVVSGWDFKISREGETSQASLLYSELDLTQQTFTEHLLRARSSSMQGFPGEGTYI